MGCSQRVVFFVLCLTKQLVDKFRRLNVIGFRPSELDSDSPLEMNLLPGVRPVSWTVKAAVLCLEKVSFLSHIIREPA